jgi:hypothetical protein
MNQTPFEVGERVHPDQLTSWEYRGVTGKPGRDTHAARRFVKGDWVLELRAHKDPAARTKVLSIRTQHQDATYWSETRQRLMRHKAR